MALLDPGVWAGRIFSGKWEEPTGGVRSVIEPATGAELGSIGIASVADVGRIAEIAATAQKGWARESYEHRASVLRRAAQLWRENATEVTDWIVRESGSVPVKAGIEIEAAAGECNEAAALAAAPHGELLRSAQPRLSFSRQVPVGVVGVIAPFNFPLTLSIRSVAPALALGNSVILKPDPRTAVCGGVTLAEILSEAGVPEGVFNVLPGGAEVGEALVIHPLVRVIAFTGSTRAGRAVGALAGQHLKRAHLELGGNSALIVMNDVDLDRAASVGAFGSFLHQGQICMTTGRHIVDARIVDDYISLLADHASMLPVGNPATEQVALGPIIDAGQRDNIHELVTESVRTGARLAAGGTFDGLFYRPTVLANVTTETVAYRNEVFGPVAPVISYDTIEEAIALASDSEYGLSLGILAGDGLRALELAQSIPTGAIHINDQTVTDEPLVPFGGVGVSGTGSRVGGQRANLEAFTETQWVTAQSTLPDYPF